MEKKEGPGPHKRGRPLLKKKKGGTAASKKAGEEKRGAAQCPRRELGKERKKKLLVPLRDKGGNGERKANFMKEKKKKEFPTWKEKRGDLPPAPRKKKAIGP